MIRVRFSENLRVIWAVVSCQQMMAELSVVLKQFRESGRAGGGSQKISVTIQRSNTPRLGPRRAKAEELNHKLSYIKKNKNLQPNTQCFNHSKSEAIFKYIYLYVLYVLYVLYLIFNILNI